MKTLALDDRPREKLERLSATALGDNELVAILVGHGTRHLGALDIANAVLAATSGLHGLTRVSNDELRRIPGVGAAKAARILAAVETGRRTLMRAPRVRVQLGCPREVAAYLMPQYGSRPVEQFGIVLLDTKRRVIRSTLISIGTLDTSVVHPREVFSEAARAGAASIVLFHNHPSGDPTPSPDDVALTRRLVSAGELMGIEVVDHVVLAETRYCSFKESGRL